MRVEYKVILQLVAELLRRSLTDSLFSSATKPWRRYPSIEYRDYRKTAWRVLIECKIVALPIDLNIILECFGVHAYPYQGNENQLQALGLDKAARRTSGMAFYRESTPIIMYDNGNPPNWIRFTIAHELGHLALGHLRLEDHVVQFQPVPYGIRCPMEEAANRFAVDLLAPACVLWGMDLHTATEIATACTIPSQAAQFQAQRMEKLYRRNNFLSHPLERVVYQQFIPFITEWRDPW